MKTVRYKQTDGTYGMFHASKIKAYLDPENRYILLAGDNEEGENINGATQVIEYNIKEAKK